MALHIPDFPVVAAARRAGAEVRARPCAVLGESSGKRAREKLPLLAVNRAAREAGIVATWPLSRALVRCPDLTVLERDGAGEAELGHWLVSQGELAAAEVEWTRADTVIVDLAARPNAGEYRFQTSDPDGVEIWWTKAATPDLADLAVRVEAFHQRTVDHVEVAHLPIEALTLIGAEARDLERVALWGLRTIHDFLRLPKQALTSRIGVRAKEWQELLSARRCRVLLIVKKVEKFIESIEIDDITDNLETIVWIASRAIQSLALNLASKRFSTGCLKLSLALDGGDLVERELRLAEPQARAEAMLAVVRPYLESLSLPSGVVRLEVEAVATFGMAVQREWFGKRELPQPERWTETVGRLEAMLGAERVGIPVPPDSFRPDAFTLRPALAGVAGLEGFRPDVAVPLRRYRPPLAVAVAGEVWDGWQRPLAVLTGGHAGRITAWRGPFPGSGQWWEPASAWQRVEWDVENASGEWLRLAWLPPGEWQVEGVYG